MEWTTFQFSVFNLVVHSGYDLGAAALQQPTVTAEKKPETEAIVQCKNEATGGHSATAAKKLVGNTQQVNPELLRYV